MGILIPFHLSCLALSSLSSFPCLSFSSLSFAFLSSSSLSFPTGDVVALGDSSFHFVSHFSSSHAPMTDSHGVHIFSTHVFLLHSLASFSTRFTTLSLATLPNFTTLH